MELSEDADRDWEWLPELALDLIVNKLVSLRDFLQFGAVCKRWCSFARHHHSIKQRCLMNSSTPQLPLLLLSAEDNNEGMRGLYDVVMDKTYNFQLHIPFNRRISGSSHGWLLIVEEGLTLTLLNPFSGKTITLPRFDASLKVETNDDNHGQNQVEEEKDTAYEYHITKMALSRDPYLYPHDFELMVLYDGMGKLGLYRACDNSWTHLIDHPEIGVFEDVIFYNNTFYMADHWRGLGRVEWTTSEHGLHQPHITKLVGHPASKHHQMFNMVFTTYIVETSCGDVLYIVRFIGGDDETNVTSHFKLYKLKLVDPPEWEEINSVGSDALFLGDNHSTSVSALDYGCHLNCIYYTDDLFDPWRYEPNGPSDIGIYDLNDTSFRQHYKLDPQKKMMTPPLWILPTLRVD